MSEGRNLICPQDHKGAALLGLECKLLFHPARMFRSSDWDGSVNPHIELARNAWKTESCSLCLGVGANIALHSHTTQLRKNVSGRMEFLRLLNGRMSKKHKYAIVDYYDLKGWRVHLVNQQFMIDPVLSLCRKLIKNTIVSGNVNWRINGGLSRNLREDPCPPVPHTQQNRVKAVLTLVNSPVRCSATGASWYYPNTYDG